MADVANNIWRLAGVFDQDQENKRRHAIALADIGLQRANVAINANNLAGQQSAEIARAQREKLLDEPVTIGQAIDTHPTWTDQEKEAIKSAISGKNRDRVLNHPTTRRKMNDAITTLRKEESDAAKEKATSEYRSKMLNLRQQEINAGKANAGKEKYTVNQQMNNLRGDYKTAIDSLKNEFGEITDKAMQRRISEAYRKDKRLIRKKEVPHHLDDLMSSEAKREEDGTPPLPEGFELLQ